MDYTFVLTFCCSFLTALHLLSCDISVAFTCLTLPVSCRGTLATSPTLASGLLDLTLRDGSNISATVRL